MGPPGRALPRCSVAHGLHPLPPPQALIRLALARGWRFRLSG
uniref:Uncharacterized protein n=1 Tax=Arundo donax TaxID=35708 RepID=A0A0A9C843_ARUDO